jgi:hypothetical protein
MTKLHNKILIHNYLSKLKEPYSLHLNKTKLDRTTSHNILNSLMLRVSLLRFTKGSHILINNRTKDSQWDINNNLICNNHFLNSSTNRTNMLSRMLQLASHYITNNNKLNIYQISLALLARISREQPK